jgi:isoleucyl-tRNA synthetase
VILDGSEATGDSEVLIEKEFIDVQISAKEGFAAAMENNVFTILDTTITDSLKGEGYMREFVSKVQQIRKNMGLEMMDNIAIRYDADEEVRAALDSFADYIMSETLAVSLVYVPDAFMPDGKKFDLNGAQTDIIVEKV